jgi:hypothetical protein
MLENNLQHLYQITWEPCNEKFDNFSLTMHMSNSNFPLLMPNFILELENIPVVGGCGIRSTDPMPICFFCQFLGDGVGLELSKERELLDQLSIPLGFYDINTQLLWSRSRLA